MKYQVREGYTFGGVTLLPPGAIVELTEAEAEGFLDKLQPVEEGEPSPVQPAAPLVSGVVPNPVPAPEPEVKGGKRKG